MALPTPPDNSAPIPNNPFYSNLDWYIRGPYGPLIVGTGLSVSVDGVISSGGGGSAVNSITAGPGISVNTPTGNVIVTNTGVTSLVAGTGINVSGTGTVTITATNLGTVTGILTGVGLTGGPINSSGTISLDVSGVSAGIYTNPTLNIDAYGRVVSATSNSAVTGISVTAPITISGTTTPTIGILPATTTQAGAVQLSDAVNDPASVCAATTAAVKTAYDIAIAAIPKTCVTGKGALITGTAASTPVALPVGTDGQILTACAACGTGLTWGPAGTVPSATPSVEGIVYGCTDAVNSNYGLGDAIFQGLTTGFYNVAIGANSLCCLQSGNANVGIGPEAMEFATTGCENIAIGFQAANNLSTGFWNVSIGTNSMNNGVITGFGNIALGKDALNTLTSGRDNVGLGRGALNSVSTGRCNIGIGYSSNGFVSTGCFNISLGAGVNVTNPTGNCQLALGPLSGSCWLTGDSTLAIKPGAGIIDCNASCGSTDMALTSQGNAVEWKSVTALIPSANYGSFINSGTQIIGTVNVSQPVEIPTVVDANNFTLINNSEITAGVAGTYNLQFSLQLVVTTGGGGNVEIWLAKNGNAVPNSNTRFAVKNVNEAEFAALNFIETLAAGDNLQLIWVTDDIHIQLFSYAAGANFAGAPAVPSAIVTIVPVGA